MRHLCFAAAGKILSDPEVEAGLVTANTLVHPLDTLVIAASKSFTCQSKILLNMITKDVNLDYLFNNFFCQDTLMFYKLVKKTIKEIVKVTVRNEETVKDVKETVRETERKINRR